jgi:hypothetical protein
LAKAPFSRENLPAITTAAQNVAAGTADSLKWVGVTTDDVAIATGGETNVDSSSSDTYSDVTNQYTIDPYLLDIEKNAAPKLSDSRQFAKSAQLFNTVFVCGGQDEKGASDIVEIFTSFNAHEVITPMRYARTDHAVVALDDNVIIAGGSTSKVIECYTINFTPRTLPNELPVAVRGLAGCRFGEWAVFAGGRDYAGRCSSKVYAMNKSGLVAENIPDLSVARYNLSAAVVTNPEDSSERYLIIAGGKTSETVYSSAIDVYDSNFNKVTTSVLPLNVGRSRMAVGVYEGYALFAGGVVSSNPDVPTDLVEAYNYRLEKMDDMKLSSARNSVASTVLGETIMFIGGVGQSGAMSNVVDGFKFNGSGNVGNVTFEYTSNSENKNMPLPKPIEWKPRTRIYPKNLPALPVPATDTVTVTGWYTDSQGTLLIGDTGAVVGDNGAIFYVKSLDSSVISVSFDYAKGDQGVEDLIDLSNNVAIALDADILGEDNVLPTQPVLGQVGDVIDLPPASEMAPVFEGTDEEMKFLGWYDTPEPDIKKDEPITQVTLGDEDLIAFAVYEPVNEEEREERIEVKYMIGVPEEPDEVKQARTRRSSRSGFLDGVFGAIGKVMPYVLPVVGMLKKRVGDPTPDDWALATEWVDFAVAGEPYVFKPPVPTDVPEGSLAATQVFVGYFKDFECTDPFDPISDLKEDTVVYCKFATKPEVVFAETEEDISKTYSIEFRTDGLEDAITEDEDAGLMPPDVELPPTMFVEPVVIEDAPEVVDEYDMPVPQNTDGYEFEGYYSYDEKGNKVEFDPTEPITKDLVLHPSFEFIGEEIEEVVPVTVMVMDPNTVDTKVEDWDAVPLNPLIDFTNPMVPRDEELDPSDIEIPNIPEGFRVATLYRKVESDDGSYVMEEFKGGVISDPTTLFVKFESAIPEMPVVTYQPVDGPGEETELVPVVDVDLAAPSMTTYQGRPADLKNSQDAQDENYYVAGLFLDEEHEVPFDPAEPLEEGKPVEVWVATEQQSSPPIMVTVDYYPPDLIESDPEIAEKFEYATPAGSALPAQEEHGVTITMPANSTAEEILDELGDPTYCQDWEPEKNSAGTCYWIKKQDGPEDEPVLIPFEPDGFALTESITLYPQYEVNYEVKPESGIENIPTTVTLSVARGDLAGVSVAAGSNSYSSSVGGYSDSNREAPEVTKPKGKKTSKQDDGSE